MNTNGYITQASPPVVVTSPPEPHPATPHKSNFQGLGITQVVLGILCMIGGAVSLVIQHNTYGAFYLASGIWGGAWFIVCGSLGIASGSQPNSCNVIAGLVISIIASLVAFSVMSVEAAISAYASGYMYEEYGLAITRENAIVGYAALHGSIAVLAFIEFIVAIVHSAYCCCGTCGRGNQPGKIITGTTTITTAVPMHHAQAGMSGQFGVAQSNVYVPAAAPQYYMEHNSNQVDYPDTQKLV